jgi:hypothetical protein
MLDPRLQAGNGHEAPLLIVWAVIAIEATTEGPLLHLGCELGDQLSVFDADLSCKEGIGGGLYEVKELQPLGDEGSGFACFCGDFLDGVLGGFLVEKSAKPLRFLEGMQVGPQKVFDKLRFLGFRIAERGNADRNLAESCPLRGTEALRPGHDFIMSVEAPHKQG